MNRKHVSFFSLIAFVAITFMSFRFNQKTAALKSNIADTSFPLDVRPKGHKGKMIVSSEGVIRFSSGLDNDYYFLNTTGRSGYLYVETKIGTFINDRFQKIPLNLSIVIDRSGSMQSVKKMDYAKSAAKHIIDKLTENDYVSIVIYDEEIIVLHKASLALNKQLLKEKIDSITPRGSTNLWGGSEAGYEQVKQKYNPGFINRVLLISDGLANAGLINSNIIKTKVQRYKDVEGITLSSFGVGLEYNEILMSEMAEAGAGNYYFIGEPDKMEALFDKELNGLLTAAAQNAELKITLPQSVQLKKIFAAKYQLKGSEITIRFRDLFSEETKGVLLEFSIPDNASTALKFISTIAYHDVSDGQEKKLSNENMLKSSTDKEIYLTHFNQKVREQRVLYVANEQLELAMLEADKGNYNKARSLIKTNTAFLNTNKVYLAKSVELRKMDSTNKSYFNDLKNAEKLSGDSVKYFQKAKRSDNYKIRNKKF